MDFGLSGKIALVTGGSHGIGLATALALADEGCSVAICARDADRLENARALIEARGAQALAFPADVLVADDVAEVVANVVMSWGTVHILVNNVGGGGRWGSDVIESVHEDVWTEVYAKNATAAVRFTRLVIPLMRSQRWGRVVTVASILGREGGGRPWFNMAKSAEISLMKTLAMNHPLVRDGITFNSVAPGSIMIPGTGSDLEKERDPEGFAARSDRDFPLGRLGTPQEVADGIVFLCSERASLINGACVTIDGGEGHAF